MKQYCIILFLYIGLSAPCTAQPLTGIWENNERFIEYVENEGSNTEGLLRMVMKTYYRFVYEDIGAYPVTVQQDNAGNRYALYIRYPQFKTPVRTDVWVHNTGLFTSFYKKIPCTIVPNTEQPASGSVPNEKTENTQPDALSPASILEGFWIEQGYREGILIYQQEAPAFFDAFFFTGTRYIRFRYWKGDFELKDKGAQFICENGDRVTVPKFIRQNDTVYSCITDNGSKLKNYEKGSFSIDTDDAPYRLTVTPQGGGPGTHAVGDTYPHSKYPQIQALPLYYDEQDAAFAFGAPFLIRSSVSNLPEEIIKHNHRRRPPPEPLFKADELDFYRERIKEIRKQN